ncbi:cation:proton antiporter [uncultured Alistipes sp.]|uniref:cation:proton antiporter n=1 Tax=uncultured Alistipes sp. TaxID=538949 RepID=UPI0025F2E4ED|nr:cation:proton antiporter [uncultured Alistipes sp.]
MLLTSLPITLPIEDPILKFLIILVIIFAAPLILNKLKVPYLLGLIIAGAIIGPHGLNLMLRDSSIILSGTAGLLYIMFLSGLDMDMSDFKRSSWQSLIFGLYTFLVPLGLGFLAGYYIMGFPLYSSILLAGLFASQTLIAYPIVSKLGIARDKAVTIAVGGTVITDTLALLLLTVIVGMATGTVDETFWWRLSASVVLCIAVIIFVFPLLAHWFFKQRSDSVSQYIFVLALVFLGAYLAHLAGLEPIIGAFLSGLALNRLIPRTSPLMNRIEFVGNAIFIPFFLIGVGMLIDYKAFFRDWESLEVAAIMIVLITLAKFLAAYFTQKTFRLSKDQRTVIFGLSSAHVAATLAAVMVGYNVILGHTPEGEPIRLLSESVLNGTILMILATCIISTFATQRGAHNIAVSNAQDDEEKPQEEAHILIPVANEQTAYELVALSVTIKRAKERNGLYALNAIDNKVEDSSVEKRGRKVLDEAAKAAASADNYLQQLLRYDVNIANAIVSVVRERNITDIVMGVQRDRAPGGLGIGRTASDVLWQSNVTTFFYNPVQPLPTIRRHLVIVPEKAEKEAGFQMWLKKLRNLAENSGAKIVFHASENTMKYLKPRRSKRLANVEYVVADYWNDLTALTYETKRDDCLWIVMSRRERISYHPAMSKVPAYLEQFFADNSFVLLYPVQAGETDVKYL